MVKLNNNKLAIAANGIATAKNRQPSSINSKERSAKISSGIIGPPKNDIFTALPTYKIPITNA